MPFILSVDYDGTVFSENWPNEGSPKQDIIDKVQEFRKYGAELVLWTCREGHLLDTAVRRCKEVGLEFDAVNENAPSQMEYMAEQEAIGNILAKRKIFANFYLDDRSNNLDIFLDIKDVKGLCKRYEYDWEGKIEDQE